MQDQTTHDRSGLAIPATRANVAGPQIDRASLDFVKGCMIVLLVCFHADFSGPISHYTVPLRGFAVSFFLPIFFFVSGYLTKPSERFGAGAMKVLRNLGIPYLVFVLLYLGLITLARNTGVYPIRQPLALDTWGKWLYTVFVSPVSPYYYLYAVAVFRLTFLAASRLAGDDRGKRWAIQLGILLALHMSPVCTSNWPMMCLGLLWQESRLPVPDGRLCLLPFAVICGGFYVTGQPEFEDFVEHNAAVHLIWCLSVLGITVWIASHCVATVKNILTCVGRNTLSILVMHVFALKAGLVASPWILRIEPSGALNGALMVTLGVFAPIACTKISDSLGVSLLLFGRSRVYQPFFECPGRH